MLVNGLPLIIVVRMRLPVCAGQSLRGLVRLEAQVAILELAGSLIIA
jgi:hypothetical protein